MSWSGEGVGTDTYGGRVGVGGTGVGVTGMGVAVAVGTIGVEVGKTRVAVKVGEGVLLGVGARVAVGETNSADGGGDGRSL